MKLVSRVLILSLLLVAVSGCTDQEPVEPVLLTTPQFSVDPNVLAPLAEYENGAPRLFWGFAMKTIGPAGGRISLAGFEVIVPPGAVRKNTLFTIHLPAPSQEAQYVRAQFGPHMTFDRPVTLRLPLSGTTAEDDSNPHVLWWDGTQWIAYPTVRTSDGRIETTTTHFSEYGTEDPSKGIILVGGGS